MVALGNDGDDNENGDDNGGPPSTKEPRKGIEGEFSLDEIAREMGLDDDALRDQDLQALTSQLTQT